MAATTQFRQHHKDLSEIVRKLEPMLAPDRLRADAASARDLLSKLAGVLKVHLAMEDSALYPRLRAHGDAKVREVAQRFASEMGGLKETFTKYMSTWRSPEAIQGNAGAFVAETRSLFAALAKRVSREEAELYPLLDASA
jgi:hypothetical protein